MSEEKQSCGNSTVAATLWGMVYGAMLLAAVCILVAMGYDAGVQSPMQRLQRDVEFKCEDKISTLKYEIGTLRQEINQLGNRVRDAQAHSAACDRDIVNLRTNVINHDRSIDRIFRRLEQLNPDKEWEPEPPEPQDDATNPPKPV